MIIRGGENIYPSEIEQFLHHHPKIQEVEVLCKQLVYIMRMNTVKIQYFHPHCMQLSPVSLLEFAFIGAQGRII
jgi:hypothetical protein